MKKIIENTIKKFINENIEFNEAKIEISQLVEHVFGFTKKDIMLNPSLKASGDKLNQFNSLVKKRLKQKMPVQYLINKANFMGEWFYVDENVLIPRPETEILVETVLKYADKASKIIDIGSGSGCIAIMLAKNADFIVTASDISEKALETAAFNANKLGIKERIKFIRSDLFKNIEEEEKFDVIVSNPPYISPEEKENLQPEVVLHEPHTALFAEDKEGVSFYEKLAQQAVSRLNPGGFIAVEVGFSQADKVKDIFMKNRFKDISLIQDFSGIQRVVIAWI
ncbi:MAG TPA: peptide chain release factor N(5)-glutamine methyltransferase [Candidatus Gastranaerophilales bacterium]|nr:peptide chain release factor N(5)-glutamine methyltransferase [Candidatus Gastranaerophilales bacterium]